VSDWQLQDAKNRLSEVVKRACNVGPQTVTVHGRRAAVVVSADAYDRLARSRKPFKEYLLEGLPWSDELVEAINDRSRDTGRTIEF
jgi:prevent-host-death family protein